MQIASARITMRPFPSAASAHYNRSSSSLVRLATRCQIVAPQRR